MNAIANLPVQIYLSLSSRIAIVPLCYSPPAFHYLHRSVHSFIISTSRIETQFFLHVVAPIKLRDFERIIFAPLLCFLNTEATSRDGFHPPLSQHPDNRVSSFAGTPSEVTKLIFFLPTSNDDSTPGTGKTTHASQLVEALQAASNASAAASGSVAPVWEHVNVGDFVKDKACHSGWNEEWQSWDVDEDKVSMLSFCIL